MLDIAQIKRQLDDRLEALSRRIEEVEGELRTTPSANFGDQATDTEADEVLEGLEESAWLEIAHIRAAQKRIDSGVYGECAQCGELISSPRCRPAR